jgi:hypothetical protein
MKRSVARGYDTPAGGSVGRDGRSVVAVEEGVDGQVEADPDARGDGDGPAALEALRIGVLAVGRVGVEEDLAVLAVGDEVGGEAGLGVALDLGAEVVGPVRGRHFHDHAEDVRGVVVLRHMGVAEIGVDDGEVGNREVLGQGGQPETDALHVFVPCLDDSHAVQCPAQFRQRQGVRTVRRRCHREPPLEDLHAVAGQRARELIGSLAQGQLLLHHGHGVLLVGATLHRA